MRRDQDIGTHVQSGDLVIITNQSMRIVRPKQDGRFQQLYFEKIQNGHPVKNQNKEIFQGSKSTGLISRYFDFLLQIVNLVAVRYIPDEKFKPATQKFKGEYWILEESENSNYDRF